MKLARPALMTPAQYVQEIVVPTVREARDEPKSRRRAYLACIVVFHINDHLKKAGIKKPEEAMRKRTGLHFDVVRAVCNGTKHFSINESHVVRFETGSDWYRPPAILGVMRLGISRLGDTKGGREFRADVVGSGNQASFDIYASARAVLLAFVDAYPAQLASCDVTDC